MEIMKNKTDGALSLTLSGRLDTTTAPQLEAEVQNLPEDVKDLVLDFAGLQYISSAGLRVLLAAQKKMNRLGSMTLKNVGADIKEVFDITGFSEILTIV